MCATGRGCAVGPGVAAMNKKSWLGGGVLLLWQAVAAADETTSGDWVWSVDDPGTYYAGIENSAGQALMQLCDTEDGACFYAVTLDTRCREGETYFALVNSDAGANSLELHCGAELKGRNLLFVQDFDRLDGLVRKATRIGFAIPMQGDEFKAVRFSLKGSVAAIDAMRRALARVAPAGPAAKKTRDVQMF